MMMKNCKSIVYKLNSFGFLHKKTYLYEFKMALFNNGNPEEFLLFVRNLQMALKASGALAASTAIQYISMLFHGETLPQIYALCVKVRSTTTTHLNCNILGFGTYFPLLLRC